MAITKGDTMSRGISLNVATQVYHHAARSAFGVVAETSFHHLCLHVVNPCLLCRPSGWGALLQAAWVAWEIPVSAGAAATTACSVVGRHRLQALPLGREWAECTKISAGIHSMIEGEALFFVCMKLNTLWWACDRWVFIFSLNVFIEFLCIFLQTKWS